MPRTAAPGKRWSMRPTLHYSISLSPTSILSTSRPISWGKKLAMHGLPDIGDGTAWCRHALWEVFNDRGRH